MLSVGKPPGSPKQGSLDGDSTETPSRKVLHFTESPLDGHDSLERKLNKSCDKSMSASKLSKRESLKEKKKSYRSQKKEVAREIMNSASDQSIVLMADWLKVRGTLKGWTKLFCVCKPAMLIIYKSEKMKTGHWVGTILLNTCQLLQRPSKKEGFCFKLFHPLDQSIWATKGPKGETIGAFVQPLPMSYAIFRAPSENQGKCWMDGLELALRCTSLIKRTTSRAQDLTLTSQDIPTSLHALTSDLPSLAWDDQEADEGEVLEEHFSEDDDHSSLGMSESDFELAEEENKQVPKVEETVYMANLAEELGQQGDACQTEEVNDENKSLIWTLVKQVRPGMDLSKVVLPTFILEPRSFLDKLTDYYYHADILSQAVQQETALERMKRVVKWYLSGFYKKPKGLKKPYNPIIGETFRCYWMHPETKSRTFYVAEQISHHPPVSAFHVTNRHDGFNINGCILAKSKFYGNSISAILDGVATLTFLERGEDYLITMPYAHCKGILLGTLTMEMGGKVSISCPKTGYHTDLDFKLKPFFGNGEAANRITGRIRMGSEVLCTFEGHWDQQIYIKELTNREKVVFWDASPEVRPKRLVRHTVPLEEQELNESEKLWRKVSEAVVDSDMHAATAEKHRLEEIQRSEAKERHKTKVEWEPKLFALDSASNKWIYKHVDTRPWDSITDCVQYERGYVIQTQTVHTVPPVWRGVVNSQRYSRHSAGGILLTDDSLSSDTNAAGDNSDENMHVPGRVKRSSEMAHHEEHCGSTNKGSPVKKVSYTTSHHRKTASMDKSSYKAVNGDHQESPSKRPASAGELPSCKKHSPSKGSTSSQSSLHETVIPHHTHGLSRKAPASPGLSSSSHHHSTREGSLSKLVDKQMEMQKILEDLVARVADLQQTTKAGRSSGVNIQRDSGLVTPSWTRECVLVLVILVVQTLLQWFLSR